MSTSAAPIVALTGATGFLGRHLIEALMAKGWHVRALVRALPVHEQLAPYRLELVPGDLDDKAALERLVRGAEVVVHMAGAIKGQGDALMKINGQGTQRLVRIWQEREPSARFLYVSSLTAREPHLSAYGASKKVGEEAVMDVCGNALIVRPSAIYGPWDRETLSIFKAARWPLHPMLNGKHARLSLIHVRDAADALCALANAKPQAHIIELSDQAPNDYAWPEIVAAACRASSRTPRPFLLPPGLVKLSAFLNGSFARARGRVSIFDEGKAREILHPDWTAQDRYRVPEKIWSPKIALDDGFAETAKWYRKAGWL